MKLSITTYRLLRQVSIIIDLSPRLLVHPACDLLEGQSFLRAQVEDVNVDLILADLLALAWGGIRRPGRRSVLAERAE